MKKPVFYLAAVGLQALVSAALIPLLTHNLPHAEYGHIAFIGVAQQLATMLIGLGLPGLVTSWESGGKRQDLESGAAWPVLLLGSVCLVGAAVAGSTNGVFIVLLGTLNALISLTLSRSAARGRAGIWALLTICAGPVVLTCAAIVVLLTGSFVAYLVVWALGLLAVVLVGLPWSNRSWYRAAPGRWRERLWLSLPLAFSSAAALALASGDRLVVGAVLGSDTLAPYQAAYAIGNLALMAGTAITNHWLPGLMRDEPAAKRAQLLAVSGLSLVGVVVAEPALLLLLPDSYHPSSLWPVAAIAALSALPQSWYLQAQARATYLGGTRSVGTAAVIGTVVSMAVTVGVALFSGSYVLIALVTPLSYAALTLHLRRMNRRVH